jgi:glucan biosynthesis protein C
MQSAASTLAPTPGLLDVSVARKGSRLLFVDNMRTYLTVLVIAHHLMVIYTGSGGWLHYEGRQDDIAGALGGWFCAVNQSYFMGLFLLLAAYFVPGSYDRKGPKRFLIDRLVRLGIPLAVYSWLLRPLYIFFAMQQGTGSFWQWYRTGYFPNYGWIGGGPLWFIEVLLLFSLFYVVWMRLTGSSQLVHIPEAKFPSNRAIVLFALLMGSASFLVRLVSPVNDTFGPLNLQFANFSQYVALFIVGLMAYRRDWLSRIPRPAGRLWLAVGLALILLYGPLAVLGGATEDPTSFLGGWHWQALMFALWDAFLCVSMCVGLLSLFRVHLNKQGPITREFSRSAYAAYLIHEPVITSLTIFVAGIMIYPLLKFVVASVVFIPICFGLGSLLRRLPRFDAVL